MALVMLLAACGSEPDGGNQSASEVAQELSEVKLQPGEWEATSEILDASVPGLPPEALAQMKGQKTVISNCVTPEQAEKPDASFLAAQKNADCSYQDFSMRGGRMTGTMTCAAPGGQSKIVMKMDGTYAATKYDMNMDMQLTGGVAGQVMTMKARATGKRVGACA